MYFLFPLMLLDELSLSGERGCATIRSTLSLTPHSSLIAVVTSVTTTTIRSTLSLTPHSSLVAVVTYLGDDNNLSLITLTPHSHSSLW